MSMRPKRDLKRKVDVKDRNPRLVLVMEGSNTEPEYFDELSRRNTHVLIDLDLLPGSGVPATITRIALDVRKKQKTKKYVSTNGDRDQVWAVFDRDDHPLVKESIMSCEANDINVAFSNPCFELWLILHVQDYDKDEHRSDTQDKCAEVCKGYNKSKRKLPDLSKLIDFVEDAEKRADSMQTRRDKDAGEAPITTVQRLSRVIRGIN